MYIFALENSSGLVKFGVALLSAQGAPTIEWMLQCFKENNTATTNIRLVMRDNKFTESRLAKSCFCGVKLFIDLFHTLKSCNSLKGS